MAAYYNDNDPKVCAWLRELISAGLIAPGEVDNRPIQEIKPDDLKNFVQCHFFAGIGGWSRALRLAGWNDDEPVWTCSCPCQPFSAAGQGRGTDDERHLWPVFFRLVEARGPGTIFGEQVASAAVVGKTMQNLRKRKARKGISEAQQGRTSGDLQRLREQAYPRYKAVEITEEKRLPGKAEGNPPGVLADHGCTKKGQGERVEVRFGLERNSDQNRNGRLRGDGNPVRLGKSESMEHAISGSDNTERWLHEGEHESSPILVEHDGERVGDESDFGDGRGDASETVIRCIQRLISTDCRQTKSEVEPVWLDRVRSDLEGAHYSFGASVLAACSVSAPHIRQRAFWVAYAEDSNGSPELESRESSELRRRGFAGDRTTGGVAEPDGGEPGNGDTQRSGEHGQQPKNGCPGSGMAKSNNPEWRTDVAGGNNGNGNQTGWIEGYSESGECREIGERLGDPTSGGCREQRDAAQPGSSGHLISPSGARLDPWSNYQIILCRDGKARRIPGIPEPSFQSLVDGFSDDVDAGWRQSDGSIFPLAKGVQGRTGILRGAGNSIAPEVAAEFIRASEEARQGLHHGRLLTLDDF